MATGFLKSLPQTWRKTSQEMAGRAKATLVRYLDFPDKLVEDFAAHGLSRPAELDLDSCCAAGRSLDDCGSKKKIS